MNLAELIPSFERHLRAKNLAPRTIVSYVEAAHLFDDWLAGPFDVTDIRQEHIEGYIDSILGRASASHAATHYRRLQQLWRWLADEEEIDDSPMRRMTPPKVPDKQIPVIPDGDLRALLADCEGKGYEDRRDMALCRLLIDTGIRAAELVGLTTTSVDWDYEVVTVLGKGRKPRSVPFGRKTGAALDRYLRVRRQHRFAELPALWLGTKGPLSASGVQQMLDRRTTRLGIGHIHPHMFRHSAASEWLSNGGQESDLMRLMGWTSPDMVRQYAKSTADQRAREAHKRMGLGDRY